MKPRAYVFYQYMPPDDVVSAVHFGDLCSGLAARGWQVSAFPCIRSCRDPSQRFASFERWRGVMVRRIYRPGLRPSSGVGRMLNSLWMVAAWSLLALRPGAAPDVVIVGTDPPLSVLVALFWRLVRPGTRVAHWCFDLYPEVAAADGLISDNGPAAGLFRFFLRGAYGRCSLLADIGPCMRDLLLAYPSPARRETLVPWALIERAHPLATDMGERDSLFGRVRLALLYSGTFGRAHSYEGILDLAEALRNDGVGLVFSIRGNREAELRAEVRSRRSGITFVDFAPEERLQARLACADVHIVSLRPEWTGMVVPSKFFGAISAGRPVLFLGSERSSIARWIQQFQIGWVLAPSNVAEVASALRDYASSGEQQTVMRERCCSVYAQHFAREVQIDRWDLLLREISARLGGGPTRVEKDTIRPRT